MISKLVSVGLLLLTATTWADQRRFTEPYASRFEKHLNRPIFTHIYFDFLPSKVVGLCEDKPGEIPIVYIDLYFWSQSSASEKEELLFHELGHCELGRRHNAYKDPQTGCPLSIMYPTVFGNDSCYLRHRDKYIKELFGKQKYFFWKGKKR